MLGFGLIGKLFGDKQNVVEAPVTEQAQAQPRAASQIKDRIAAIREQYTEERRNYGYTKGHNGIVTVSNQQFFAFIADEHLRLFQCPPLNWKIDPNKKYQWRKQSIALSNIQYFAKEGTVYTETRVSGGGDSGPNYGGAIIGGLVAGPAGAIIASQPRRENVRTDVVTHDDRATILVYNKGKLKMAATDFAVLMSLIPEKELSYVQSTQAQQAQEQHTTRGDHVERLKQLQTMLSANLITEEEFCAKKQEILSSL